MRSTCIGLVFVVVVVGFAQPAAAQEASSGFTEASPAPAAATAPAPASTEAAPAAASTAGTATPPPAAASASDCECVEPPPKYTLFFGMLSGGADTTAGPNPYGYGIGWQAGVTVGKPSFYFGISFPWYAGNSRAFQVAADFGYDFRSGPAVLRPLIAVGGDRWRIPRSMMTDLKDGAFLFEVGWHLHFDLGRHGYLGGEFRWSYTTHGGDDTSWHAWGIAGVRFSG